MKSACFFLALWVLGVCTQPVWSADTKVHKLLIVNSQKGNPYDEIRTALVKALASYGYVEGRNLKLKELVTANDIKAGEKVLEQESREKYDVIYVGGTAATISARNALYGASEQRVVFAAPTDPVGIGVIRDFGSRPQANFTGVCYPVPVKARLRFVKQLMPQVKTLGLIFADMPQSHSYNRWLQETLASDPEFRQLKILFRSVPLVTGEDGDRQMAEAAIKHILELDPLVDVFLKPNDQMGTRRYFSQIFYANSRKPLIGIVRDDVMAGWGASAVIYPSHASIGEQAATMVRTLFEGGKVADITPEGPKRFGFALDMPKVRQFGLQVPIEILQLAGEDIVR